ncbi:MAG: hypothetical protein R2941_20600 [Desulfobacterales bacterium]
MEFQRNEEITVCLCSSFSDFRGQGKTGQTAQEQGGISEMTDTDIEKLIPQRDHMKLLDAVVSGDGNSAVCESVVNVRWPMREDYGVSPLVLIELTAQTSAVCISLREQNEGKALTEGKGWLVGIKSAEFFTDKLPLHTRITTTATIQASLDNYTEIHGISKTGAKTAGEIVLQVMRAG